jgi:predicted transcriptional regulator
MKTGNRGLLSRLGLDRRRARSPELGVRELAIMECLWRRPDQSAQEILADLEDCNVGLSTVQSTLERLHRKDLVSREKSTRAFYYRALRSRQDIINALLQDITRDIAGGDRQAVISSFVSYLAEDDEQLALAFHDLLGAEPGNASSE